MSTGSTYRATRLAARAALLALAVAVALRWPLAAAIGPTIVLGLCFAVAARLPPRPDKPPVDRSRLSTPTLVIYWGSTVLLLVSAVWYLVALFFATDARGVAAPVTAFVLSIAVGKWNLNVIRRSGPSRDSRVSPTRSG
jgi:hypothetical protein